MTLREIWASDSAKMWSKLQHFSHYILFKGSLFDMQRDCGTVRGIQIKVLSPRRRKPQEMVAVALQCRSNLKSQKSLREGLLEAFECYVNYIPQCHLQI